MIDVLLNICFLLSSQLSIVLLDLYLHSSCTFTRHSYKLLFLLRMSCPLDSFIKQIDFPVQKRYLPKRYVLYIMSKAMWRKKEEKENWKTSRQSNAGLHNTLTICLQSHSHKRTGSLYIYMWKSIDWQTRRFCSFSRLVVRSRGCQWLFGIKRGQWTIIFWPSRLINYNVFLLFNCLSFFFLLLKYRCYSFQLYI